MKVDGKKDKQIDDEMYYNANLFKGCVHRYAPPPSILYWRVRAVYALYRNMIDSKTNKLLINT